MGVEDGDSDSLKICHSSTMGTDERLSFLTASTVFNEDQGDIDFRVESNTTTDLFFCDAGANRVGIGTASPSTTLDVGRLDNSGDCELSITTYDNDPADFLQGSIPGESLTGDFDDVKKGKLGKYPWETPPQINTIGDAFNSIVQNKEDKPKVKEDIVKLLDSGVPSEAIARTVGFS